MGGLGGWTAPDDRRKALVILDEAVAAAAQVREVAVLLVEGFTTVQRRRRHFAGDCDGLDRLNGGPRRVSHRITDDERPRILLTRSQPEFAALPKGQILSALADRGICICSECRFHRVLHAHGQAYRRGRSHPPQEPRPVPWLQAREPISSGARSSPICSPASVASGPTSIWLTMSGAAR